MIEIRTKCQSAIAMMHSYILSLSLFLLQIISMITTNCEDKKSHPLAVTTMQNHTKIYACLCLRVCVCIFPKMIPTSHVILN